MGMMGYERFGTGPTGVVILNDWIGDTSTWDGARQYLDTSRFSWVFADLRGYGRSKGVDGRFNLEEAAADVLQLVDELGWERFAIVGHSMSTLIALHLAQHAPERVRAVVLLTPPPPRGFGVDDATLERMKTMALSNDSARLAAGLKAAFGGQLSDGWVAFKAARWNEVADRRAVAAYVPMFARHGLPDPSRRVEAPVLAVTGELDGEPMRKEAVSSYLQPICAKLTVEALVQCGHYPMQEMPPLLVTLLERFLSEYSAVS